MKIIWPIVLCSFSVLASAPDPKDYPALFEYKWLPPSMSSLTDSERQVVEYGKSLLTHTYKYLDENAEVPYSGNKLSCTSCHLSEGTKPNAGPFIAVSKKYAGEGLYSSRTDEYRTLPIRINGCFQRSMNGSALPQESAEMQAMVAYMEWLATGLQIEDWKSVPSLGMGPDLELLSRAASPNRGAEVYKDECETCHGENGEGRWDTDQKKYRYPALWGPNSFNNGAGMNRLRTTVKFVKHNMPYGKEDLTDSEAWDVSAYIVSQSRPLFANQLSDWSGTSPDGTPNWKKKKVDAFYPNLYPRVDGTNDLTQPSYFPVEQHKFGPYQEMLDLQNQLIAEQ